MPIMTSSSWNPANDALHASNAASSRWVAMCQGGAVPLVAVTSSPLGTHTAEVFGGGHAPAGQAPNAGAPTPAQLEARQHAETSARAGKVAAAQQTVIQHAQLLVAADLAQRNAEFLASVSRQEKQNLANRELSREGVSRDYSSFRAGQGSWMYLWSKHGLPGDSFKVQDFKPLRTKLEESLAKSAIAVDKQKVGVAFLEERALAVKGKAASARAAVANAQATYEKAKAELAALAPELARSAELELQRGLAANLPEARAFNKRVLDGFKKACRRTRETAANA